MLECSTVEYSKGNKNMKIGILTYWWASDNYGQLLQCYALQKYLRDLGHEAFLIRYNYNNEDIRYKVSFIKRAFRALNPVIFYKHFKNKILLKKTKAAAQFRKFDEFRNRYILLSAEFYQKYENLKATSPEADAYIVGSDQVWNFSFADFECVKPVVHAYMLDFGANNVKRLSYAASWGVSAISEELKNEIIPLIRKFDYVAVREQKGLDLCRQCGIDNAEWVCDPTLLLEKNIYREMYNENEIRKPKGKYIFVYMLSNKNDFDLNAVYRFAKKRNLDVIFVNGNYMANGKKQFFATIPEWLYLIDNAEYVISNSFHCAIFSLLFGKQFGIIKLIGIHEGMNTRLDSLFDLFGIPARYINSNDLSMLDTPYKPVRKQIENHFLEILFK